MSRWRAAASFRFYHLTKTPFPSCQRTQFPHSFLNPAALHFRFTRPFSALPSEVSIYSSDSDHGSPDFPTIFMDLFPKKKKKRKPARFQSKLISFAPDQKLLGEKQICSNIWNPLDDYEVKQCFDNLDFKRKSVVHNIHFFQEVIRNRQLDLLEWRIIFLLTVENVISTDEIVREINWSFAVILV